MLTLNPRLVALHASHAKIGDRMACSITRVAFILSKWEGVTEIFDRDWQMGPDLTIFCDVAIEQPFPTKGSYGKAVVCEEVFFAQAMLGNM